MQELSDRLKELQARVSTAMEHLDIAHREEEISRLEKESAQPDFWLVPAKAQNVMRQLAEQMRVVQSWRELERKISDAMELTSLAMAEADTSVEAEIQSEIENITSRLDKMELDTAFSGDYDGHNAIMTIHAGAGGTESQDWAEMLLRMYLRHGERRGYRAEVMDTSPGEETGVKSVIFSLSGDHAYGYLKSEHGVHRLVRLSPFDADHARHTSFALVEVIPEAEPNVDVEVNAEDLKIDTFRASGPGGQHMQKTSSAIRVTHLPSGLVVTCQGERSQHQNKESALTILQARLLKLEMTKKAEEQAKIKGKRINAGWGNQIRSYVLHPYKMVKDHRTDYQTSNAEAVLDGDLDGFINAYLRFNLGKDE
ncbi:peptide chain release factor 2 [Chloroflexota bacterium]